jgi:ribosome-binding factor A
VRPQALRACAQWESLVLKRDNRRGKGAEFIDMDFAELLYGEENNSRSKSRQAQRKAQQFCRQVQRALNLALADSNVADTDCDLFVDEVSFGPDCGHLVVHIVVQDGHSVADAMSALPCDASRLRSEVAMAIARKPAPEFAKPASVIYEKLHAIVPCIRENKHMAAFWIAAQMIAH